MKPDFILLTETWCNPSISDADLSIPGYQLEVEMRKDRADTAHGIGGGLLVYSRCGLKILLNEKMNNIEFNQFVSFSILTEGEPVNVILVYRPPNSGRENIDKLCELLRRMQKNAILIGDINLPHIDWESGNADTRGRALYNTVQEENLEQLIRFPTHDKGNTLDLLITNMASSVISVSDEGKLGKSDHCIILTEVKISKAMKKNRNRIPNWTKADYQSIRTYLSETDWETLISGKPVSEGPGQCGLRGGEE